MKKRIIAFDLDGVLCDLVPGFCKVIKELTGHELQPHEWVRYDQFQDHNLTFDQCHQGLIDHNVLEDAHIPTHIADALRALWQLGYELAIITKRGWHPQGKVITETILDIAGLHFTYLFVIGINESKIPALQYLQSKGQVMAFVEDHTDTLHEASSVFDDIHLIVRDQPWNRHCNLYPRIVCASEILTYPNLALSRGAST